ncbi:MAG: tryptophan synthase subunit alpha [Clostridia bacterium BRH_c25]|nr:MAG: tryptophan synthase subunit alpha [Clostridia bacterium BRH_c25]
MTKLICYLAYGYPSIEESLKVANAYMEAGCDIIEIGLPTHDAFLDNEAVASRMNKALENCSDYEVYLDGILRLKKSSPDMPLILLAYEHTILDIGLVNFSQFCSSNELDNLILVGAKDDNMKNKLMTAGIKVSEYVTFKLSEEEVKRAKASNGFVYLQSKPMESVWRDEYETLEKCICYLHNAGIDRPIYCGVGVSTPEDVRRVASAGGDGAFIGSSILKLQGDLNALKAYIIELKSAAEN